MSKFSRFGKDAPASKNATAPKGERESRFGGATVPGVLYDRNGPIPVPEVKESDTDSAWAMFEESVLNYDHPITRRDDLRPDLLPDSRFDARPSLRQAVRTDAQPEPRQDFASTDIAPPDFLQTEVPATPIDADPKSDEFEPTGFERTRESPL